MFKVNNILQTSRVGEVADSSQRIINAFNQNDWSSDTHLTGIFDKLKTATANLTAAIKRVKVESILEEKDSVRDTKVRNVFYNIQCYLGSSDMVKQTAAAELNKVMNHYGLKITEENYSTESAMIYSLLDDLNKPENKTASAKLPGLDDLIAELTAAQTDFEDTRLSFQNAQALEGTLLNASKLKLETASIINEQIVGYLTIMVQVNKEKYNELAITVAQIIDKNNEVVKKRRERPDSNKGNDDEGSNE